MSRSLLFRFAVIGTMGALVVTVVIVRMPVSVRGLTLLPPALAPSASL